MMNNLRDFSQIMTMVQKGDPQKIAMSLLQESSQNGNPVANHLMTLAQSGNSREIERIARNIAQEKGIDFDKEFNSFKQMFRL